MKIDKLFEMVKSANEIAYMADGEKNHYKVLYQDANDASISIATSDITVFVNYIANEYQEWCYDGIINVDDIWSDKDKRRYCMVAEFKDPSNNYKSDFVAGTFRIVKR